MHKKSLITGAVFGFVGIVLGAFAAHGLEKLVAPGALDSFQVGVRYQMYHAILLLWVGSTSVLPDKTKVVLCYLVLSGVILFSGSIYGLSTNDLTPVDFRKIAFITPVGGLLMIVSWVVLLVSFLKMKSDKL